MFTQKSISHQFLYPKLKFLLTFQHGVKNQTVCLPKVNLSSDFSVFFCYCLEYCSGLLNNIEYYEKWPFFMNIRNIFILFGKLMNNLF